MTENWQVVVRYRNQAELLRIIASDLDDDHHKAALLRIAAHYENTADALERDAREERPG